MVRSNLYEVYEYAYSEGIFESSLLKNITCTVCDQSNVEVIDFDKAKENVCNRLRLANQLKSCDALKIIFERNKVVFIEMKSFQMYKNWHLANKLRDDHDRLITKQIEKFNIPQKFIDSIFIFDKIWEFSGVERDCDMKFTNVILTDIELKDEKNSEELIEFTILYLADESIPSDILIQAKMFEHFENNFSVDDKPLLMTCNHLEIYLCA